MVIRNKEMEKHKDKWTWKIRRWVKYELPYLHTEFFQGVKNLIKWFRLVWKDRDWDDHFIFEALKFKIQNTSKYIGTKQRFVGWEDEVRYMNICVKLIDRIQEDWYQMEYMDYEDSKIEFVPSGEDRYRMEETVTRNDLKSYIDKHPNSKKQISKQQKFKSYLKTERGTALAIGVHRHVKARKLLFKILEEKIQGWWD